MKETKDKYKGIDRSMSLTMVVRKIRDLSRRQRDHDIRLDELEADAYEARRRRLGDDVDRFLLRD